MQHQCNHTRLSCRHRDFIFIGYLPLISRELGSILKTGFAVTASHFTVLYLICELRTKLLDVLEMS
jgi:hypothetical protein